jgi:hypothetical protein
MGTETSALKTPQSPFVCQRIELFAAPTQFTQDQAVDISDDAKAKPPPTHGHRSQETENNSHAVPTAL